MINEETWQQRCKRIEKERKAIAATAGELEISLALANGCVDPDRCNGHITPQGSCTECIIQAIDAVKQLKEKGYKFSK